MLWENLREEEFDAAIEKSNKVCVVPIGCLEKHGQHLPVGTDTQTAYYIAKEATKLEDVVVFPPVYFGDVLGLYMWKGTIAFSSELLQQMLTELCAEIARNGFKKILILNGHGGIMETAILNVINPDSVDMSRCNADDGTGRGHTKYLSQKGIGISLSGAFWLTDYPNSLDGEKFERANARIGQAILRKRIAL